VLPLLGVFTLLSIAYLTLVLRAQHVDAWRVPLAAPLFRWVVTGWVGQLIGMAVAMIVAVWAPIVGLVVAVATGTVVSVVLSFTAPSGYRAWRARPGL
jgi:hypothetical protein